MIYASAVSRPRPDPCHARGRRFAAGSAGAFNCYIDRDIDKLMHRTEKRPLVTGEVTPREALVFAWLLGAAAIAILWFGANPLSAWARPRRHRLLRGHLHDDPQAPHGPEHRLGRRRGLFPRADRLGRRDQHRRVAGHRAVHGDLPLDAAALLAAVHALRRGLPQRQRADAGCHRRRQGRVRPGGPVRVGHGCVLAADGPGRRRWLGVHRYGCAGRRLVPVRVARPLQPGAGAGTSPTSGP